MSRIGLKPIELPEGVEVNLLDENVVEVKGPKGTLKQQMVQDLTIKKEDSSIIVERPSDKITLPKFRSVNTLLALFSASFVFTSSSNRL